MGPPQGGPRVRLLTTPSLPGIFGKNLVGTREIRLRYVLYPSLLFAGHAVVPMYIPSVLYHCCYHQFYLYGVTSTIFPSRTLSILPSPTGLSMYRRGLFLLGRAKACSALGKDVLPTIDRRLCSRLHQNRD